MDGASGDRVYLAISTQPGSMPAVPFRGVFLYGRPPRRAFLGTFLPGGSLSSRIVLSDWGPGVDAGSRYMQAVRFDTSGQARLASPVTLVILDQAF